MDALPARNKIDLAPGSAESNLDPIRLRTARSALGAGIAEIITRVLTVVLAVVTARALEPRDVGLLGIAVIVVGVISVIGYYPETAGVAIREQGGHNAYALAASIIRASLLAFLLVLVEIVLPVSSEKLLGGSAGKAQLRQLISVLLWGPVLECLSCYPQVILQRRLDLRFVALAQVSQAVVFVLLATVLLLRGSGYMGVAAASLTGTGTTLVLLWLRLWRLDWVRFEGLPTIRVWRESVLGSYRVFVGGFGSYLGSRLDNLLVSGVMGPAAMSYYSMAWNASRTPTGIVSRAISFVLIPTFAGMQDETERLGRGLRECLQLSYMALAPVCALMFVCAPDLVTIVLGVKWTPAIPALRLMSVTILVGPLLDASNALLVGTGRAQFSIVAGIARIIVLFVVMQPLAFRWGLSGAVWGDLISGVASAAALFAVAQTARSNIRWSLASAVSRPIVAATFSGFLAWGLGSHLGAGCERLACQAGVLSGTYLPILAAFGGKSSLVSLCGLLRNALLPRVPAT